MVVFQRRYGAWDGLFSTRTRAVAEGGRVYWANNLRGGVVGVGNRSMCGDGAGDVGRFLAGAEPTTKENRERGKGCRMEESRNRRSAIVVGALCRTTLHTITCPYLCRHVSTTQPQTKNEISFVPGEYENMHALTNPTPAALTSLLTFS